MFSLLEHTYSEQYYAWQSGVWATLRLTLLLVCRVQAPEVYARNFGTQADMWSLGMLAYQALSDRCDSRTLQLLFSL